MAHVPYLIKDLALILVAAAVTTLLFRYLKQPLVLGYILAGLLVGPDFTLLPTVVEVESIRVWAEIGVIFLLFGLGLEFSFKKLVKVGGGASVTGLIEILAMLLIGYATGQALGWSSMDSLFLGGMIAISSTTIIIRAFEEMDLKSRRFVSLVFGILIVEDLAAILLLVLLSTLAVSQQVAGMEMLLAIGKLGFFLIVWFLVGIFVIPSLLRGIRRHMTDEMLLILSIGLCLLMVVVVTQVGFSAALGAFVMGSILSETIFVEKIEHLFRPVRDLFGAVFFVSVGMLIDIQVLWEQALPVAILSLVVIFGKSIAITLGSLVSGQSLRHAIQSGLSMTQIGEFSFIIATLGMSLNVISPFLYPIAVAVSAITTFTTPYMIRCWEPLYTWLERVLPTRWKLFLNRYSTSIQQTGRVSEWQKVLQTYLPVMMTNTAICVGIILVVNRYLTPLMGSWYMEGIWSKLVAALVALFLMAPFLWALSVRKIRTRSYDNLWKNRLLNRGPLVVLEGVRLLLGILMVGFLLDQFFSWFTGTVGAILLIVVILPVFTTRLQATYVRIEKLFLYNLHARWADNALGTVTVDSLPTDYLSDDSGKTLSPWDGHLAWFNVSPQSASIGKTLTELAFREKYGVSIARIERGHQVIIAPRGEQPIYPGDRLTVVGTDEQLARFKPAVEIDSVPIPSQVPEIILRQLILDEHFPYLGMSIRQSKIREETHGLVVGIERNGQRLLNPDPAVVFEKGDVVWLSAEKNQLAELERTWHES